jgi:hypothetical protein
VPAARTCHGSVRAVLEAHRLAHAATVGRGSHSPVWKGDHHASRFYLFLLALLAAPSSALALCTAQIVGNDFIINGCNVHIRNGTGSTTTINGLGNLIIGYNENTNPVQPRGGSHNLVVGKEHGYTNVAGVVSGEHNKIDNEGTAVIGGEDSVASGEYAVVSGGQGNAAIGNYAAVSGGTGNAASGQWTSVSGGLQNNAIGSYSWIGTGTQNVTNSAYSSITGGLFNTTSGTGTYASITGGLSNSGGGYLSVITGGSGNQTLPVPNSPLTFYQVVNGGSNNIASHTGSTVSGGCGVSTTASCQELP